MVLIKCKECGGRLSSDASVGEQSASEDALLIGPLCRPFAT
jgi:hypothetical protein